MPSTPAHRRDLGKLGNASRQAAEDPREMTAAAREIANWQRYYDRTDPALPETERTRKALALRDAHMARMRLAKAAKRKR